MPSPRRFPDLIAPPRLDRRSGRWRRDTGPFAPNSDSRPIGSPSPWSFPASGGRGPARYRYLSQLGAGATAIVGRVLDTHLNRIVAQKVFHEELVADQRLLQTFLNEARLVGYLNHPGIIPVYGLSVNVDGQLAYTMPVIEGDSLSETLQVDQNTGNGRALSLDLALSILIKLCETMS